MIDVNDKDKIFLYGAGKYGEEWIEKIGACHIYAFVDRNADKMGSNINGISIINIDLLKKLNADRKYKIFISLSEKFLGDVKKQLQENGFGSCIINSPYSDQLVKVMDSACINAGDCFEGFNYVGFHSSLIDCELGYASYVSDRVRLSNVKCGRYSSIAEGVSLIKGRHPSKGGYVSTHPAFFSPNNTVSQICFSEEQKYDEYVYTHSGYSCEIGNDVWIGKNVMIKEGVRIGDGAIVAAGAVVVKDVEPYEIVGGVPARKIRSRFSNENIKFLIDLKWWDKDMTWIKEYSKYFCDIDELINRVNKDSKK